jgi:hypothetical protein
MAVPPEPRVGVPATGPFQAPQGQAASSHYLNPDNGFLLCWQRVEREAGDIGFDGIELIGGDGSQEMQESIYRSTMFGEIERGKSLDVANDSFGQVAGVEQHFIGHG